MKKIISLFTMLSIVLGVFCTFTVFATDRNLIVERHIHKICDDENCPDNHTDIEWTAWDSTDTLPTEAGNYYLTKDITLTEHWESVNKEINLCLNGHIITVGGYTMYVASETTFTDCTDAIHKFSVADNGLWVLDEQNGTETVTGGVITGGKLVGDIITAHSTVVILSNHTLDMYHINIIGNQAKNNGYSDYFPKYTYGGGVFNSGIFNMYSGKIIGNTADYGGGVNNVGTFNMMGGEISGNISRYSGGGVDNTITFNMTGGKIINNTAGEKGGGVNQTHIMTIGGTAIIKDNNDSNLYVYGYEEEEKEDYNILFDENTPLTDSAYIGITSATAPTVGNSVDITGANNADYSKYLQSDNENYKIVNGKNNVIQLEYLKIKAKLGRYWLGDNDYNTPRVFMSYEELEIYAKENGFDEYNRLLELYPQEFFEDKFLYVHFIDSGSGSNKYAINTSEEENSINIEITKIQEGMTDDYFEHCLYAGIDKSLENKDINVICKNTLSESNITYHIGRVQTQRDFLPEDSLKLDYAIVNSKEELTSVWKGEGNVNNTYGTNFFDNRSLLIVSWEQQETKCNYRAENITLSDKGIDVTLSYFLPEGARAPEENDYSAVISIPKFYADKKAAIIIDNSKNKTYPYQITSLRFINTAGEEIIKPSENQSFIVETDIVKTEERNEKDYLFVAVYDEGGALMSLDYVKAKFMVDSECSFGFNISAQKKAVGSVKAFVWSTFNSMEPLAETKILAPVVFE